MIPTRLFLSNFMCYRDNVPPLHLDGIHLACLCGDNGNGKSALIDAITWALWGKSRAKNDDELIHQGRTDMEVALDFVVAGNHYRVTRQRAKPRSRAGTGKAQGSGQTLLDLQVAAEEGFKSIGGNTVAQTQQRIVDILRMDYATFVNSAFLRQGHADEFTIKPPGERKKVLADIMGLSLYDELEEKAKSRVREKDQQLSALQSAVQEMQHEIERRGEYEEELLQVRGLLAELEKDVEKQESQVVLLRERKKALDFKQQQLSEAGRAAEQAETELSRWQGRLTEHRRKIAEYEEVMDQRPAVEDGHAQLQKLRKEAEELNRKLEKSFALVNRRDRLVGIINESKGRKLEERGRLQSRVDELEAKASRIADLERDLAEVQAGYDGIADMEKDLEVRRQQSQELTLRVQQLKSSSAQLRQELEELKEKLSLLVKGDARCPLCETELGVNGKQRIEQKYKADIEEKSVAQRKNEAEMREKSGQQRGIERQISQLESKANRERASSQRQIAALEKELSLGREAEAHLVQMSASLQRVEEQLAKGEFAMAEQQELGELGRQIAALGYDADRHQQVRELLVGLEQYQDLWRKLEEADRRLPSERKALNEAEEAISGWDSTLRRVKERGAVLAGEIAAVPELVDELGRAEQEYDSLRRRQTGVRDEMVIVQERLARCAEMEEKKRQKEKSLLKTLRDKEVYEELAQAFGKKGVQAFLIESAVPEIEEEANRLLGRMTDDGMRVTIETQRETKKGETVETLDIKISDELGTRSYEMYSGGEAFRINLALRIALSKVLARRAGAPLPTLFMDEGFGTQDSDGLTKLVGAINSIQDDFKKIIVITHLEELKDAFPVRIEVTKTGEGSTISLS